VRVIVSLVHRGRLMATCGSPGARTLGSIPVLAKEAFHRTMLHPIMPILIILRDAEEGVPISAFWLSYMLCMVFFAGILHTVIRGVKPFKVMPAAVYAIVLYAVFAVLETLLVSGLYTFVLH